MQFFRPITKTAIIAGVVLLVVELAFSQYRHGQLRREILNSAEPKIEKAPSTTRSATRRAARPLRAPKPLAPIVNPINTPNTTLVYLENTETLAFDQFVNPDKKILKGNVRFKHDDAYLYCDSAYFYEKANSLDAFGNVRIVQGDSLFVYGDFLYYDGNLKLARMRSNVKMINRNTTLTTDSLNFDRNTHLAYYFTGGKIVDPENTLTSIWGQYNTQNNDAEFRNKVELKNKNYRMVSDTLLYNTQTYHAKIVGPTFIRYQDETDIFSSKGWYNTNQERMMLLNRSKIVHHDGKTMTGDTLFYDKAKKYGEAFVNVELTDSLEKSTLYGDYVFYDELKEAGLATDSALLVDWSTKDTLWIHADTLRTFKDSIYDVAKGIGNVRMFRNDVQAICDTLHYSSRDSIISLHGEPVMWADNNQLSGEFIQIFTQNQKAERVHIQQNAIAAQQEDSVNFNQLSGKEIIAHLRDGELYRIHVNGNAETIYFPRDDADSTLIGLNKTESSFVVMHLKNKKADRIVLTSASSGVMYPLGQLTGGDIYLKNFFWVEEQRPTSGTNVLQTFPKPTRNNPATRNDVGAENTSRAGSSPNR